MLMAKKAKGFKLRQMRKEQAQKEGEQARARASASDPWIYCSVCRECGYIGLLSGLPDECRRKYLRSRDDTGPMGRTFKVIDGEGKEVCLEYPVDVAKKVLLAHSDGAWRCGWANPRGAPPPLS